MATLPSARGPGAGAPETPPALPTARFWLYLGIGLVAGLAVGVAALARTTPVYAAEASVLVAGSDVNLRTEAELVAATDIVAEALARLGADPARPVVGTLAGVAAVPGTSVLVITFEATSAVAARDGATAVAEVYLAARAEAARVALDAQLATVQDRLDEVRGLLGAVTAQLERLPPDAAEVGPLRADQELLASEAEALTAQLHELRTTAIDPGRIVAAAELPTDPVRPDRRWLGVAAVGGAVAGVALHLIAARWTRRIRHPADLRRHRGIPILAELVPVPRGGAAGSPAKTFNRLRNEVVAALSPAERILLVTGVAPGSASLLVSANLAAAFARADSDVVLVGASVPELDAGPPRRVSLAKIFDLADIPGLTDVLAGRTSLPRAVQGSARHPRLRVVTPGGTGSSGGLLQSEGARSILRQLATRSRYVIVDAPSTASGADAQSLAARADAALLVVELNRSRHDQVADALTQLSRVGARVLGAVVVSRAGLAGPPPTPRQAGEGGYDTEGWIGARPDVLAGPTAKLPALPRWPLARERPEPATAGPDAAPERPEAESVTGGAAIREAGAGGAGTVSPAGHAKASEAVRRRSRTPRRPGGQEPEPGVRFGPG